jgi:ABC-type lipoprotein export system ATPase subunit
MALIALNNISKTYFRGDLAIPVLHDVTLELAQGDYVALVGPSGSGKSTLLNIIGCLDRPTSGEYLLDGRNVGSAGRDERAEVRNELIGFVFQGFQLLPRMSALDNVLMPLTYARSGKVLAQEGRKYAQALLAQVGLQDRMYHDPSELSGGQQQRVAIARALINRPKIIVADEPTGNLDSATTGEILEMFVNLHKQGITIILVTHEAEVWAHAQRVIRLKDGRILS